MKLSETGALKGLFRYTGTLNFDETALRKRVCDYIFEAPEYLYRGEIVTNDRKCKSRGNGYVTTDGKSFCEVISDEVIKRKDKWIVDKDEKCTYNPGKRESKIKELFKKENPTMSEKIAYCGRGESEESETKLIHCLCKQKKLGEYSTLDFQVPTTNGKKDNIDLILEDAENVYMVEAKTFGSKESLVRCVLEISTYYMKLNDTFYKKYVDGKRLKKAVMFDSSGWAMEQCRTKWGKNLLKAFDVVVFELSREDFSVKIVKCD